jgi:hypothetical protein
MAASGAVARAARVAVAVAASPVSAITRRERAPAAVAQTGTSLP